MKSIEQFDETLDINSTENYELAIEAGQDGFAYCLLDTLRNKFVLIRAYLPEENKYFNSGNIKDFIINDDFLTKKYKKVRIILPTSGLTIVPAPLFDPARKDAYYQFNQVPEAGSVILSNRNPDPELFILFAVQGSLNEVIASGYPGIHPCNHLIPLFDHTSKEQRGKPGNHIHAHIERDYFNLIIFVNNDLKLCNTFKYRNITDILYFILNVFSKMGIRQEETIHLSGNIEKFDDLSSVFSIYIRNLEFAKPRGNFNFSYVFNDIELHRFLNLFTVFNCG